MLLTKVLNGDEQCGFVLIEDTLLSSGHNVLKTIVRKLLRRVELVKLYLYECDSIRFTQDLPKNDLHKLHIYDWSSDVYGWLSNNDGTLDRQPSNAAVSGLKSATVIDCVSSLILHTSNTAVCRLFKRLGRQQRNGNTEARDEQIVTVVHRDLHDGLSLGGLEQMADCILKLSHVDSASINTLRCSTTVKRSTGKVLNADETVLLLANDEIVAAETKSDFHAPAKLVPDPAANLTFNLRLSLKEEEARKQVQLPYVANNQRSALAIASVNTLAVEDAEEIDEDPDDDLDI